MEPPERNTNLMPTVKCTSCAADIDITAVENHVCPLVAYDRPVITRNPTSQSYLQHDHRPIDASSSRSNRPPLPRIDSSTTSRSGLRPSEAASIAHDLGLPSPLSAGSSGRRSPYSRSRSRKASTPRPPSPDGPVSQDCAFPHFPTKPKRTQTDKDIQKHKVQSTNRSTTTAKPKQHSPNYSTSSSVYSTGSAIAKRRASNTSSSQRSRQGTIDETMSLPSTAPSSPRHSEFSPLYRDQSLEQIQSAPALGSTYANTFSEPSSSASTMPPTPLWPLDSGEPSPRLMQSPSSEIGWTPTESTIIEEQTHEIGSMKSKRVVRNQNETFDSILSPDRFGTGINMFDNPPKEPLYKTKRPAPLLQPSWHESDGPEMPLSARLPPTQSASGGGLTRTLTNIFGRKRSQSSISRTMPLPSSDSLRARALAPEPPERPQRAESLWHTTNPSEDSTNAPSVSSSPNLETSTETITQSVAGADDDSKGQSMPEIDDGSGMGNSSAEFDFKFDGHDSSNQVNVRQPPTLEHDHNRTFPDTSNSAILEHEPTDFDPKRASIDSASSYGSIGFSHRTDSSRSDLHHEDQKQDALSTLSFNQPSTIYVTIPASVNPVSEGLVPDSPTDPLYYAGKLSPVPESEGLPPLQATESDKAPDETLQSQLPKSQSEDTLGDLRPSTPAAIKGRCRGCSNNIIAGQKSISSADGRLTGKYHKECFVCQTCKEAFATADFYVYDDHPYCAHHYHVLNNTLCTGCGKGIEGQYLETFDVTGNSSKKFHHKCLQCATCKVQLNEDYFEYHGRVYCERDAFRAASGPRKTHDTVPSRPSPLVREYINSGEPGLKGRFPERRITRLIMT